MLTPEQENLLHRLVDVFLEENSKLNLSAFRTPEQCWIGNVLDSLSLLDVLPQLGKVETIFDIGTGGGFPLLPLAICLPSFHFVGIDSTKKKIDAIGRIAKKMNLTNVEFVCGRAEELGHDPRFRERADLVTARGVAEIATLLEFTSPFVKPKGHVVLWKSLTIEAELQSSLLARAEFSTHLKELNRYKLPADWGERQLLILEKSSKLTKKYPRGVGVPKKEPLQ